MLGAGRPKKSPTFEVVRALTREDLAKPRGQVPAVRRLRESHHMVARLVALGLRNKEICDRTGYTPIRISILRRDPAFQELVASYMSEVDDSWREELNDYFGMATRARNTALRMVVDQLEEAQDTGEEIPIRTLLAIQSDLSDRTGYGKRSTQVNFNVDFAAQLEQAIKRSNGAKQIEGPKVIDAEANAS